MKKEHITKMGYYEIHKINKNGVEKYEVDSGQYIFVKRLKKYILNPYRDKKTFSTLGKAKEYIGKKLTEHTTKKQEIIEKLPKSLYLVLIKEQETNKTFVKVGITSKKFLIRRFSKEYGYKGYVIESILRRIDTPNAEKLEEEIKEKLGKKKSVKKYRPILESFSGYSECFDYMCLQDVINVFDSVTKNI
jgi:nitrogenase molybdenum-iron protein alpha/beta subunit